MNNKNQNEIYNNELHNHNTHDMKMEHNNHDMNTMKMEHNNHDMNTMKMEHDNHDMSNMDMNHSNHDMSNMDMSGHDHSMHGMMDMSDLKKRLIVAIILTIPIIILSPMMGIQLPFQVTFNGSDLIFLILATILFFYGGKPFFSGAKTELKDKKPAMMTLIALGISVAYFYSLYAYVNNNFLHFEHHVMDFFWELATLIVIMLLGHYIEMNAVMNAGDALSEIAKLIPNDALKVDENNNTTNVAVNTLNKDDIILVNAGESFPVDGIIISGQTNVNESLITGESKLVEKKVDDHVIGGSINGNGSVKVKVENRSDEGFLNNIINLVQDAQAEKSKQESISDKVAGYLFYVALTFGIGAFIIWWIVSKDLGLALERMVTVLVIACPHALGLAIPLVVARTTSLGVKNGLLIKNRNVLETSEQIKAIMMDKTGTLTEGVFIVKDYDSFSSKYSKNDIMQILASLEQNSNHPLAISIINKAKEQNIAFLNTDNVKTISGIGIEGSINNNQYLITNEKYLNDNNINIAQKIENKDGASISYLVLNQEVIGFVSQGDTIKEDAIETIKYLHDHGIESVMLTGDNQEAANKVGEYLNITKVYSQLLPGDKEKIISEYQNKGYKVMMVGDGINDSPALARANIGVAIGAGTDVAIDSADVILIKDNPSDIINFLKLAKNSTSKMKQNLWWGAGYNIVAIPLAAGVLAFAGIILSPAVGAILMSLSTVVVALNAMSLKI